MEPGSAGRKPYSDFCGTIETGLSGLKSSYCFVMCHWHAVSLMSAEQGLFGDFGLGVAAGQQP